MISRYLTVDLLIESELNLTALADYLEGKVLFLWKEITNNLSSIGLETNLTGTTGPEEDILEMINLISTLPPDLQYLWANCRKKVMDIGFECGNTEDTIDSFISTNTLQRIAQYGCSINIRIYPCVERPKNNEDIIVVNEELK